MNLLIYVFLALYFFISLVWLVSLLTKDASIVDRFWGLLFILLSTGYLIIAEESGWRAVLVTGLVAVWGLRLSIHIHMRNRGEGEDYRYKMMRQSNGSRFWWYSFFSVFALQASLAIIISIPLLLAVFIGGPREVLWSDLVGISLWLVGFVFEAGADWQLRKFKSDPKNKGKLLTTGFWSLSRHPNYFGDACLWFGYFLLGLSAPFGWLGAIGPVIMFLFLRYVSGAALLEKGLKKSKPGYEDYERNTPVFFPKFWIGKV